MVDGTARFERELTPAVVGRGGKHDVSQICTQCAGAPCGREETRIAGDAAAETTENATDTPRQVRKSFGIFAGRNVDPHGAVILAAPQI